MDHLYDPLVQEWIDTWREDGWEDRGTGEEMSDDDVRLMIEDGRLPDYDSAGDMSRWHDFLATINGRFDGYMGVDPTDQVGIEPPRIFVAFDPAQVKSVNNRGTFDPANPNVLFQRGDRGAEGRPALDPAREVAVIEATGRYEGINSPGARSIRARLDAQNEIQDKSFANEDTGWSVRVVADGIKKSLFEKDLHPDVRAEVVNRLPDLIRRAILVESRDGEKSRDVVHQVHRLYAPFRMNGRLNRVKLTVREDMEGARRHYAVEFVEIAEPGVHTQSHDANGTRTTAEASPQRAGSKSHGPHRPSIKLGHLLAGVKYDDGTDLQWATDDALFQRGRGGRLGRFKTEPGAEGFDQSMIPGTEPLTDRQLAERRMAEAKRAKVEQRPMDFGLFGSPEEEQADLFGEAPAGGGQGSLFQCASERRSAVAAQMREHLVKIADASIDGGRFLMRVEAERGPAYALLTDDSDTGFREESLAEWGSIPRIRWGSSRPGYSSPSIRRR